jgi:hypothetical protein
MADGAQIGYRSLHAVVAGVRLSGFAPGTAISIVPNNEWSSEVVGPDGEGAWFDSNARGARITFSLLETANANQVLMALLLSNAGAPNGILFPLSIKRGLADIPRLTGGFLFAAAKAKVVQPPQVDFADSVQTRSWVVSTTRGVWFVGGVPSETPIQTSPVL